MSSLNKILHLDKLKNIFAFSLNAIFPSSCAVCKQELHDIEGISVCPECWGEFEHLQSEHKEQLNTLALEKSFTSVTSSFAYDGSLKDLLISYKFNDNTEYAKILARLMLPALQVMINTQKLDRDNVLMLAVPMHKTRLLLRKFNQSAFLAKYLSKLSLLDYNPFAIKRTRATERQLGKTAKERKLNLKDAFWADFAEVAGKDIILVDDVLTTGTTVDECSKELFRVGVKSVHVLTLAYAVKD